MARKPTARRIARITPLAALAVAALAPSPASAQMPMERTGAGKLFFSDSSSQVFSAWPKGGHLEPEAGLPASNVGAFTTQGARLTFAASDVQGHRVDLGSPTFTQSFADPTDDALPIDGVAADPFSNNVAIATAAGVTIFDPDSPASTRTPVVTGVDGLAAGRIAWASGGGLHGTMVWQGILLETDPGGSGIPGGDPLLRGTRDGGTASGIWAREGSGTVHQLISDENAADPSISQDGQVIAFSTTTMGGDRDIWYVDRSSSDLSPKRLSASTLGDDAMPAVSPDGTQIAFFAAGQNKIVRASVDGSGSNTVVTAANGVSGLAWQPSDAPIAGDVEISGTIKVGETLTATNDGGNDGTGPFEDTYVWQACDDLPDRSSRRDGPDPSCSDIGSGATYVVASGDVGKRIRVIRVATNAVGESRSYSQRSIVVPAAPGNPTPDPDPNPNPNPNPNPPVDDQGPAAPTLTDPPAEWFNAKYPTFSWTGAEAGGRFECRIYDAALTRGGYSLTSDWEPCASSIKPEEPLYTGKWVFQVRQYDDADNIGATATHKFNVDIDDPVKPNFTMQMFQSTTTSTSATFTFENPSNEITTFECRLDAFPEEERESGPEWVACTSPYTVENLAVGTHQLEIRQIDRAGNISERETLTWKVIAKPVEQPKPTPVVETPKPAPVVTPAPVVEAPKTEPRAVAPVAKKAPALVATIGGTKSGAQVGANGGTSSAAIIEVAKESVGVGCSITGTVLKSCKVDLYAPRATGASARAAASNLVLVGTGTYVSKDGSAAMDVKIELNATGKALLRKNPAGLNVTVKIKGTPVSGKALSATGKAKLVIDRASLTVGGFDVRSSVLTAKAKRELRTLAKFGKATKVTCVGNTDGSSEDNAYLTKLGAKRAKAVCAYLARHGLKAKTTSLTSKADTAPRATNATKAGRALNRRVQITVVR